MYNNKLRELRDFDYKNEGTFEKKTRLLGETSVWFFQCYG